MNWCRRITAIVAIFSVFGCAIHPPGEFEERERVEAAGSTFSSRGEQFPLTLKPSPEDCLQYAFFHNPGLQARYWEWRMAIERIPQDASPPNPVLSFDYMFSAGNMKAWDRTTLGASNDPMTNLEVPGKLRARAGKALEEAKAAGFRFEGAKFELQGRVLAAYYDLALLGESIRIAEENTALMQLVTAQAEVRVRAGISEQQDLLKAQTELDLARNALRNLESQKQPMAAKLNALLGRDIQAPLMLPDSLPGPRTLSVSDDELIRMAAERSPELKALASEAAGQEQALSLAKQAYIPDFGINIGFTGSVSQVLGGMITMPVRLEAIRAGIVEARAGMRKVQALRAQYTHDLAASFLLNLAVLRNNERQITLFEKTIIPRAGQTVELAQTAYAANRVDFGELLEAERTLIEARFTVAELRMEREKALAAVETWSAVDVEVMGRRGATAPRRRM